jgi:tetratricopeptide (TPR) repeat protein
VFFRVAEERGFLVSRKGDFDKALEWFDKCKEWYPHIKDQGEQTREKTWYHYRLGTILAMRARHADPSHDYTEAKHSLVAALEIARENHYASIIFAAQNWLADIACWEDDLALAEKHLDEIWKGIEEFGEKRRIAAANRTRARIAQASMNSGQVGGTLSRGDDAKRMRRYAEVAYHLFAELKMYHECYGMEAEFAAARLHGAREHA